MNSELPTAPPSDSRFAVAFLQNMWVRDRASAQRAIAKLGEDYRLRLIQYSLFAGCVTGRRIKAAFGQVAIDKIVWEESTREIAGDPKTVFPHDSAHISAVLKKHNPTVVITFGQIAYRAVKPLWSGSLLPLPHPAARQPDTIKRLSDGGTLFRSMLAQTSSGGE